MTNFARFSRLQAERKGLASYRGLEGGQQVVLDLRDEDGDLAVSTPNNQARRPLSLFRL